MIAAPGADFLAIPLPNTQNANTRPAHIPPFASIKYKIDFPVSAACSIANGVKIPWLIALFRNSTCPGTTKISVNGIKLWLTRKSTATVNTPVIAEKIGVTIM